MEYRIRELEAKITEKVSSGIAAAVQRLAELHAEDVSIPVERDEKGRVVGRSAPREYPRLESGQGQENIDTYVDHQEMEGAAGFLVKEAGTHVAGSRHRQAGGEHMATLRQSMFRLGMDSTLRENLKEIADSFGAEVK